PGCVPADAFVGSRPDSRVTFFDAKKVTKETGLRRHESPLVGTLARTGTAADAHQRSSPCEASCLASLRQSTNQGVTTMAGVKVKSALIRRCAPPSPRGRRVRSASPSLSITTETAFQAPRPQGEGMG